eukprot:TRINITY_DN1712_c0_g2_i7.p1 TRINITY_DN1712_c0_g2~~TRINITY_DN1712_c0_g2_i7.p1  ORF type:complete len:420 (+),score=85.79 TRINITY_DN1712_c0_g2_i7:107-1366(+)
MRGSNEIASWRTLMTPLGSKYLKYDSPTLTSDKTNRKLDQDLIDSSHSKSKSREENSSQKKQSPLDKFPLGKERDHTVEKRDAGRSLIQPKLKNSQNYRELTPDSFMTTPGDHKRQSSKERKEGRDRDRFEFGNSDSEESEELGNSKISELIEISMSEMEKESRIKENGKSNDEASMKERTTQKKMQRQMEESLREVRSLTVALERCEQEIKSLKSSSFSSQQQISLLMQELKHERQEKLRLIEMLRKMNSFSMENSTTERTVNVGKFLDLSLTKDETSTSRRSVSNEKRRLKLSDQTLERSSPSVLFLEKGVQASLDYPLVESLKAQLEEKENDIQHLRQERLEYIETLEKIAGLLQKNKQTKGAVRKLTEGINKKVNTAKQLSIKIEEFHKWKISKETSGLAPVSYTHLTLPTIYSV